jgi:stage V sporulation protein AA
MTIPQLQHNKNPMETEVKGMESESASTRKASVFIRMNKRIHVKRGQMIRVGHVAQLIAPEEHLVDIARLPIHRLVEEDGSHCVIDIHDVIRTIHGQNPFVLIEHLGDPETVIEVEEPKRNAPLIAIVAVWFLLFIGSGMAIMNFHADVAMQEVHQRIYFLMTGEKESHPYVLQIPYSLGIGLGMVLFFNHLFKKKFNEEPSPLEVEMFLYQQNLDQYIIAKDRQEKRMKDGLDP